MTILTRLHEARRLLSPTSPMQIRRTKTKTRAKTYHICECVGFVENSRYLHTQGQPMCPNLSMPICSPLSKDALCMLQCSCSAFSRFPTFPLSPCLPFPFPIQGVERGRGALGTSRQRTASPPLAIFSLKWHRGAGLSKFDYIAQSATNAVDWRNGEQAQTERFKAQS